METTTEAVKYCTDFLKYWVAVRDFNLSCHNMGIYQRIWFLDDGN